MDVIRPSSSLRLIVLGCALTLGACDDDEVASPPGADGGTASPPASADAITESVLAACPSATTMIQSVEWPSCLAGRRVTGTEPFTNAPCELRIGADGRFDYLRAGAVAFTVPERSGWRAATGTYKNEVSAGRRIFLAGLAPDLPAMAGQPRVTNVNLSFFSVAGQDETVEIQYLDANLARQTSTCRVDVL